MKTRMVMLIIPVTLFGVLAVSAWVPAQEQMNDRAVAMAADLVVSNSDDGNISPVLGDGDGSSRSTWSYCASSSPNVCLSSSSITMKGRP